MKAGTVFLENKGNGVSQGLTIENGAFSGSAPIGEYAVSIVPPPIGPASADPAEMQRKAAAADIPEKYHSAATSGFTASIKEGGAAGLEFKMSR